MFLKVGGVAIIRVSLFVHVRLGFEEQGASKCLKEEL